MTRDTKYALPLLLTIIIAAGCVKIAKQEEPITVAATIGTVSLNQPGRELRPGAVVRVGDRVITGEKSMATLNLPDMSLVRIFEKSEFTIYNHIAADEEKAPDTTFTLDRGRSLLIVRKLAKGRKLSVKTPTAVAAVRGTTFDVTVREPSMKDKNGATCVRVLSGTVYVEAKDKPRVNSMVKEGEMIALSNEAVVDDKKPIPEKTMKELKDEEKELGNGNAGQPEQEVKKADAPGKAEKTPPVLKSEAAIREYYHKLEEVNLDDGSTLVGAVIFQNASVARIHTANGIIQVPTTSIKNIRMR